MFLCMSMTNVWRRYDNHNTSHQFKLCYHTSSYLAFRLLTMRYVARFGMPDRQMHWSVHMHFCFKHMLDRYSGQNLDKCPTYRSSLWRLDVHLFTDMHFCPKHMRGRNAQQRLHEFPRYKSSLQLLEVSFDRILRLSKTPQQWEARLGEKLLGSPTVSKHSFRSLSINSSYTRCVSQNHSVSLNNYEKFPNYEKHPTVISFRQWDPTK